MVNGWYEPQRAPNCARGRTGRTTRRQHREGPFSCHIWKSKNCHGPPWTSAPWTPSRVLAADAVEKVGNGHPGTAMSLAPAAYLLFQKVMRHDPSDPDWLGPRPLRPVVRATPRLTQYIQLYLGGYGLELDDLKSLRTWGSQDPGPPGVRAHRRRRDHHRPARPGPRLRGRLGLRRAPRARPVRPGRRSRARARSTTTSTSSPPTATCRRASPARHPRSPATRSSATSSSIYDANQISIEDDTDIAFSEDVAARYEAYGWHVQPSTGRRPGEYVEDVAGAARRHRGRQGGDRQAVAHRPADDHRLARARRSRTPARSTARPSATRRSPRRRRCSASTRRRPSTSTPRSSRTPAKLVDRGKAPHARVAAGLRRLGRTRTRAQGLLDRMLAGELPDGLGRRCPTSTAGQGRRHPRGVRQGHQRPRRRTARALGRLGRPRRVEQHHHRGRGVLRARRHSTDEWTGDPYGRVLHFGIREHAMGAILNGIVLHGARWAGCHR